MIFNLPMRCSADTEFPIPVCTEVNSKFLLSCRLMGIPHWLVAMVTVGLRTFSLHTGESSTPVVNQNALCSIADNHRGLSRRSTSRAAATVSQSVLTIHRHYLRLWAVDTWICRASRTSSNKFQPKQLVRTVPGASPTSCLDSTARQRYFFSRQILQPIN